MGTCKLIIYAGTGAPVQFYEWVLLSSFSFSVAEFILSSLSFSFAQEI